MPTSETEILSLNDIKASYTKGVKILRSVSLEITQKKIVCLIGPNGAGKSTILKAIMGLANVDSGSVKLNGEILDRYWITHDEIVNGGILELEMGNLP